ncbi:MAG TPA: inorganic phosphate transporter [Chitinophagaceae bacterium]|nr:inorganic phosphate transporter [Chitinophagaceae bacterium]
MTTFLIVIIALALIFDFINGFHDAANSIATVVSTKVLTPFQAVLWAALFNVVAYFIFKDHGVADTVAKTVKAELITKTDMLYVILSGLIAAIIWNLLTWWSGIPSSSSHTLIGGFAGAAIAHAGTFSVINSTIVLKTVMFIFLAPLIGMVMAFIISLWFLSSFKKGIMPKITSAIILIAIGTFLFLTLKTSPVALSGMTAHQNNDTVMISAVPNKSIAQKMAFKKGDIVIAMNGQKINSVNTLNQELGKNKRGENFSFSVLRKNKEKIIEEKTITTAYQTTYSSKIMQVIMLGQNFKWILLALILTIMALFTFYLNSLNTHRANKWFKRLQLISSAAFSIGHGGNDAQKVMGIITAALIGGGVITEFSQMPDWVPIACYIAIGAGTMSGGWKIVKTMGTKITKVTPFEGVAAESAGAITLFVTEALKVPVSTTHTITGAIMGVGATKRLSAVRWGVTFNLIWAWILTIPVSGLLAAGVYFLVKLFR